MTQFVCCECGLSYRIRPALERHWTLEGHGPAAVQELTLRRAQASVAGTPPPSFESMRRPRLRIIK